MSDPAKHLRQLVGIAKTWAIKSLAGWSDEAHRDLLARHGAGLKAGRTSASTMNTAQLGAALDDYERRGWPRQKRVFHGAVQPRAVSPQIAHIVRLWGRLDQAGKLDNASRAALLAFCARQSGREVCDLDSLLDAERQAVIEALKGWLGRSGM